MKRSERSTGKRSRASVPQAPGGFGDGAPGPNGPMADRKLFNFIENVLEQPRFDPASVNDLLKEPARVVCCLAHGTAGIGEKYDCAGTQRGRVHAGSAGVRCAPTRAHARRDLRDAGARPVLSRLGVLRQQARRAWSTGDLRRHRQPARQYRDLARELILHFLEVAVIAR
jgi:hypothetical protein